ncbi:MAG: hypothetical protein EWV91_17795 [Microcystis aeruginosa Ma_QC_Ca_00000000_S207]|uniref:Uncharacterized protein n=1 Tax=Microcystis aeruginosa Ma_QC_Ca_00000000_S207 TaxID=2486251 RepID=A0A552FAN7_MICAE|nr:MAG: hypothetical protein EWV91_17795 [Microcystis aeruginosa Ma_QC_Ca_00000000_S207]
MCMVRSPKSISGGVGLALGNAPYSDSDRTVCKQVLKSPKSLLDKYPELLVHSLYKSPKS